MLAGQLPKEPRQPQPQEQHSRAPKEAVICMQTVGVKTSSAPTRAPSPECILPRMYDPSPASQKEASETPLRMQTLASRHLWVPTLALLFTGCVSLDKLAEVSETETPNLWHRDNSARASQRCCVE